MGTCASQHATSQNTKSVPLRLQVETLHVKYGLANAIGFLQVLHRFQVDASSVTVVSSVRHVE